jgi:hypothetical protein
MLLKCPAEDGIDNATQQQLIRVTTAGYKIISIIYA